MDFLMFTFRRHFFFTNIEVNMLCFVFDIFNYFLKIKYIHSLLFKTFLQVYFAWKILKTNMLFRLSFYFNFDFSVRVHWWSIENGCVIWWNKNIKYLSKSVHFIAIRSWRVIFFYYFVETIIHFFIEKMY